MLPDHLRLVLLAGTLRVVLFVYTLYARAVRLVRAVLLMAYWVLGRQPPPLPPGRRGEGEADREARARALARLLVQEAEEEEREEEEESWEGEEEGERETEGRWEE